VSGVSWERIVYLVIRHPTPSDVSVVATHVFAGSRGRPSRRSHVAGGYRQNEMNPAASRTGQPNGMGTEKDPSPAKNRGSHLADGYKQPKDATLSCNGNAPVLYGSSLAFSALETSLGRRLLRSETPWRCTRFRYH